MRERVALAFLGAILAILIFVGMGARPTAMNTFVSGTVANPSLVNANFTSLFNPLNGNIDAGNLSTGAVLTTNVADNAITLAKIADMNSGQIIVTASSGAPTATTLTGDVTIGPTGVTTLAANSVATGDIVDGTIIAADIATGAVITAKILDGTIVADDIATGAVTTAKILDNTIIAGDIATGAVATAEILDGTLIAADIATGAVATAEILDNTIIAADIATGGVATAEILDGTILNEDISASAAIALSKLATPVVTASSSSTSKVAKFVSGNRVGDSRISDNGSGDVSISTGLDLGVNELTAGTATISTISRASPGMVGLSAAGIDFNDLYMFIPEGTDFPTGSGASPYFDNFRIARALPMFYDPEMLDDRWLVPEAHDNVPFTSKHLLSSDFFGESVPPSSEVAWNFLIPQNVDSTVAATIQINCWTTQSADARFDHNSARWASGATYTAPTGISAVAWTSTFTANQILVINQSITLTPTAGDVFSSFVRRIGGDAADTLTTDIRVIGAGLRITRSSGEVDIIQPCATTHIH